MHRPLCFWEDLWKIGIVSGAGWIGRFAKFSVSYDHTKVRDSGRPICALVIAREIPL